jgi:ribonuclease HI
LRTTDDYEDDYEDEYDDEYDDEEMHRLFDPLTDPYYSHIAKTKPDELLKYNEQRQFHQLQGSTAVKPKEPMLEKSSLVVHINGACRNNGKPDARAAYGVYFGPDSKYNSSGLLDASLPQTSTRAEIEGLVQAIKTIKRITEKDMKITDVKIATDSQYLVDAVSIWMSDWKKSKGLNSDGRPVAHFQVLEELCSTMDYMQYSDDGGIECQMWWIEREKNEAADRLANSAF